MVNGIDRLEDENDAKIMSRTIKIEGRRCMRCGSRHSVVAWRSFPMENSVVHTREQRPPDGKYEVTRSIREKDRRRIIGSQEILSGKKKGEQIKWRGKVPHLPEITRRLCKYRVTLSPLKITPITWLSWKPKIVDANFKNTDIPGNIFTSFSIQYPQNFQVL